MDSNISLPHQSNLDKGITLWYLLHEKSLTHWVSKRNFYPTIAKTHAKGEYDAWI